jgi:hypothetical protein
MNFQLKSSKITVIRKVRLHLSNTMSVTLPRLKLFYANMWWFGKDPKDVKHAYSWVNSVYISLDAQIVNAIFNQEDDGFFFFIKNIGNWE